MQDASAPDTDLLQSNTGSLHRLAAWLRARHPVNTAKLVAQDIGISPRTVNGWLARKPYPPSWRHFDAMLATYGDDLKAELFAGRWSRAAQPKMRLTAIQAALNEALVELAEISE